MDVSRDSDVCLPEEFHTLRVLFGIRSGDDAPRAQSRRKASGDIDGGDSVDAGIRPATPPYQAVFSRCRILSMGRKPTLSAAPACRSSFAVLGAVLRHVPDAFVPWTLGVFALVLGAALFCLVLAIFYRIGMLVGECLEAAGPPLQAYTLNLAGSLMGTLAFTALVYFSLPPWVWILPVFAGLVYFSSQRTRDALILGSVLAVIAAAEISSPVQWSPYYRITYVPTPERNYRLDVDHDFSQGLLHLGPSASNLGLQAPRRYYDLPFAMPPPCGRVLIIGAGTGNDVAAASRAQCASVDAVEIDPAIAHLGRQLSAVFLIIGRKGGMSRLHERRHDLLG